MRRGARIAIVVVPFGVFGALGVIAACVSDDASTVSPASDATPQEGDFGQPCYSNNTCNRGLVCKQAICLREEDGGGTTTDGGGGNDAASSDAGADSEAGFDAGPPIGPSCTGLAVTCGPSSNENCCTSSVIGTGTFLRSYDGNTFLDGFFPATIADVRLDRFEVTVGRFRKFVAAYGVATQPAAGSGKNPNNVSDTGWKASWTTLLPSDSDALKTDVTCVNDPTIVTWTDAAGANEMKPINCLSWYVAYAFCIWDGGRLPTEAEWNYAAAGGGGAMGQRSYPWVTDGGSYVDNTYAVYSPAALAAVGSKSPKGDGRFGHADIGGNVVEWNVDFIGTYPLPCTNCANYSTNANGRVQRGGSAFSGATGMRTAFRYGQPEAIKDVDFGVRCARNP